ncbi:MAG: DUF4153 domain-containing protein [Anaerolineaceae bacterium]
MKNRKIWYGLAALAAAWLFDFLFWKKAAGISILVWVVLLLTIGFVFAWREGKKPSGWSYLLTAVIIGFALIAAWRGEMFTHMTSILMVFLGLLLLVATFLNGYWLKFRLLDYVSEYAKAAWAGVSRGFGFFTHDHDPDEVPTLPGRPTGARRLGSVALGIILALPILIVLGLLLISADPIFGDMVKRLFSVENLPEYIFRFFYIIVIAYVLIGLLLHAILPQNPSVVPDTQKPFTKPFLGPIEGNIVLGAVNLLFIAFVVVQVRYLFGGSANINQTGYTYAEYARKGFGELVGVSVLSLLLYLVFNTITKRESKAARTGFSVLSVLLIVNVLVILASSLMRLLMYEDAYGFSELRTYTHVFIFWLAGLLVAAIVLELIHKRGSFGLALLLTVVGFCASLGLMNVDGFITQQNIQRISHGYDLDVDYLSTLSSDAVPLMVRSYLDPAQGQAIHEALGAELACRTQRLNSAAPVLWQGFRFGEAQAVRLLTQNQASWKQFVPVSDGAGGAQVVVGSKAFSCNTYQTID